MKGKIVALQDSISRLIAVIKDDYLTAFLRSLDNMSVIVGEKKIYLRDTVTDDVWAFPLSDVAGRTPDGLRRHMRDFLLNETWDRERKSNYYCGKFKESALN